jgi:hypothetical protein
MQAKFVFLPDPDPGQKTDWGWGERENMEEREEIRSLEEILEGINKGKIVSWKDLAPEELSELCVYATDCSFCPLPVKCEIECSIPCEECIRYNLCIMEGKIPDPDEEEEE